MRRFYIPQRKPDKPCTAASYRDPMRLMVRQMPAGWMVESANHSTGPFMAREQALDLANGMAQAMRSAGTPTDVTLESGAPIRFVRVGQVAA